MDFSYYVNGDRKPNKEGSDIFRFLYCPYCTRSFVASGEIIPYHPNLIKTREQALQYCKENGAFCTALLAEDGWQFKTDYPQKI